MPFCSNCHFTATIPDQADIAERVYSKAAALHLGAWQPYERFRLPYKARGNPSRSRD